MPSTLFGDALISLKPQVESGNRQAMADGTFTISRMWKARYSVCTAAQDNPSVAFPKSPDPGDNLDFVGALNAWCIDSSVQKIASEPDWAVLSATYQGFVFLPIDIFERCTNRMEFPINYHPDFNDVTKFGYNVDGSANDPQTKVVGLAQDQNGNVIPNAMVFKGFLDASPGAPFSNKFAGIETYPIGSLIWRRTSYALNPSVVSNRLFKLNAPYTTIFNGGTIPDPYNVNNHWIKTLDDDHNMLRGASILWERTEEWTYNPNSWLQAIFA